MPSDDVELPATGLSIPVDPFDLDDPDDMEALMDVWAGVAADRVDADDFQKDDALKLPIADLHAIVNAILPTEMDGDHDA